MKALNELAERFSAVADADKASRYKQETKQSEQTEQEVETEKEQKNNAAEEVKHSVDDRYDYSKSFKEQIEDWEKGNFPKRDTLIVRNPPKVFRKIGLNSVPLVYTQNHLKTALKNSDGDHLGKTNLLKLPESLENPIAIIDSNSRHGRLVALIEISNYNGKEITAIGIDGKGRANGRIIDANLVVSAYTKRNAIKKLLKEAVNSERQGNGGIYYWQKEKAIQLMNKYGVQFPTLNIKDGFIKSIAHPLSKVNKKINSHTNKAVYKKVWRLEEQA